MRDSDCVAMSLCAACCESRPKFHHAGPSTVDGGGWLATHPRATRRGAWVVDPDHWAGLPDGHTRATIVEPVGPSAPPNPSGRAEGSPSQALEPLSALLTRRHADLTVTARPLTDYARLTGTPVGRPGGTDPKDI